MILVIITDHYHTFAMLFMQLRGLLKVDPFNRSCRLFRILINLTDHVNHYTVDMMLPSDFRNTLNERKAII
jgi:hypothetical protein